MPDPGLISVARGDEPADMLVRGGRVPSVLTGEIEDIDLAVATVVPDPVEAFQPVPLWV